MGRFAIEGVVPAPPPQVRDVITGWAGYCRWVPPATVRLDRGPTPAGWSLASLTGVCRQRVCEPMLITRWAPAAQAAPRAARLVKVGPRLAAWAEVRVMPNAGGEHTRLSWRESVVHAALVLGRFRARLTDRVNHALCAKVIGHVATSLRASAQCPSGQR